MKLDFDWAHPDWHKAGVVWHVDKLTAWAHNSALTPTPLLLNDGRLRVYAGLRDEHGISRIGYVDLDGQNPSSVIGFSVSPVLSTGRAGCFDDNGVILGDVIACDNHEIRMYYVGFQKAAGVKFLAFSGLAISTDGGEHFKRVSESPILDRHDEGLFIRAIHSAIFENGRWRIWYAAGDGWETLNGTPYPRYHIRYTESADGIHFDHTPGTIVMLPGAGEYRIGRPRVYRVNEGYLMYYTRAFINGPYLSGMAFSRDGLSWERHDAQLGLTCDPTGPDSDTLAYPCPIRTPGGLFMFYNGDRMGQAGLLMARWGQS